MIRTTNKNHETKIISMAAKKATCQKHLEKVHKWAVKKEKPQKREQGASQRHSQNRKVPISSAGPLYRTTGKWHSLGRRPRLHREQARERDPVFTSKRHHIESQQHQGPNTTGKGPGKSGASSQQKGQSSTRRSGTRRPNSNSIQSDRSGSAKSAKTT